VTRLMIALAAAVVVALILVAVLALTVPECVIRDTCIIGGAP
jgi:hypothetical protein